MPNSQLSYVTIFVIFYITSHIWVATHFISALSPVFVLQFPQFMFEFCIATLSFQLLLTVSSGASECCFAMNLSPLSASTPRVTECRLLFSDPVRGYSTHHLLCPPGAVLCCACDWREYYMGVMHALSWTYELPPKTCLQPLGWKPIGSLHSVKLSRFWSYIC